VLLCAEDGLADTVRPRLEAAGADLSRIVAVRGVWNGVRLRPLILPRDVNEISRAVAQVRARLVVVDPLLAYLDPRLNVYRDQSIRQVLGLLAMVAERLQVGKVLVRHLTKGAAGNPLYRGSGSIGLIGLARSGLLVAADPDDPTGQRRLLAVAKGNLTAPPPSLAFTLEAAAADPASPATTLRVAWAGPVEITATALLSPAGSRLSGRGTRRPPPSRPARARAACRC
jgi:hypothetical protein